MKLGDRSYLLLLGKEDFAYNLDRFQKHLPDIERRMPDAAVLDLRIRETITASDEEKDGE